MVLRNSAILAFFSILSLILGIFRDRLLATVVGVGPMLDVYNASFRIPDLVYGFLIAAVSAATVVPFIAKKAHEDEYVLSKKFNSLFFFFGFTLIAMSILVSIFLPLFAQYIVPGFDEYQRHYFVISSLTLMIQPLFLGLSALISSLAQVKHRFIIYSIAPLIYTLIIIASIPLLYPRYGIIGIAWGVVAGAILSFIVQSYTLYESRMKLSFSMFRWEYVVDHLRVAIPRSFSTVVSRIRDIVFVAVATSLGVGILSIYLFAQRIIDAFMQVVVQSAATATLPLLAHKHANGEHRDYAKILKVNIISIFLVSVCAAIVIFWGKNIIVHILYGNISRASEVAQMAGFFAITLPIYAINTYFWSAFNASRDTMGLFYANLVSSVVGIAVLIGASVIGQGPFSLVLGSWTLSITYLLLLVVFYSRKKSIEVTH